MPTYPHVEDSDTAPAKIACRACRQRKVRCSKELPRCSNCHNYQQLCDYPSSTLKPGPKYGSSQKRRRLDNLSTAPGEAIFEGTVDGGVGEHGQYESPAKQSEMTVAEEEALIRSRHIQSISSLILPRNEPSPALCSATNTSSPTVGIQAHDRIAVACDTLDVTQQSMNQMITVFFRTFTAFRLFREPSFGEKLSHISSDLHLQALLAAIFAFACKSAGPELGAALQRSSGSHFAGLASKYVDDAIDECGDETPPLCVIQALILLTQWHIIKGVRGKTWRRIGLCIRLAYEMELHCVDANKDSESLSPPVRQWCEDEERRRAYWAIWEMDQFANALKQVTVTINWTQNQVFLPAQDEKWFAGQPHQSCNLAADWVDRPSRLHATGSNSTKAWYIVFCSFIQEAYALVYSDHVLDNQSKRLKDWSTGEQEPADIPSQVVRTLLNTIHLATLLLPETLQFHYQPLDFGSRASRDIHHHHGIYQLAILPQVAIVVALRPLVLQAYLRRLKNNDPQESTSNLAESSQMIEQCFMASEAILKIDSHCHGSSHSNVHPNVVHASWLAATVQLLREELTDKSVEKSLIRSNFAILKAIHSRLILRWEMSIVPKQNLDLLASRLKALSALSKRRAEQKTQRATQENAPAQQQSRMNTTNANHRTFQHHAAPAPEVQWDYHALAQEDPSESPEYGRRVGRGSPSFAQDVRNPVAFPPVGSMVTENGLAQDLGPHRGLPFPHQSHEDFQSTMEPEPGPDRSATTRDITATQQGQDIDTEFTNLDWGSFYQTTESDAEISDYLNQIFSW